ncbi:uncharacterized protein EV154DRAFT_605617 [Mucor mucedo]|uniref:uncharacterized protein n=1 Tax=Mucor mucedo TaxID=29922 RepID=UPI00221E43BE|nr:uncharacterized protein EV154DRAFT_605617 [Mucor mucedo]KAI7886544.1 hypothetical protein EV154DRAFT_605617 [Mucor mucedo]
MPFQKYTTINFVIWYSASTNVLIELFSDYVATKDAFNASDAINGRRDFAAMNNKWICLCDTFRTRRDDANSTGSAPLQHWEFHDLMEQATSRMQ